MEEKSEHKRLDHNQTLGINENKGSVPMEEPLRTWLSWDHTLGMLRRSKHWTHWYEISA